MARAFGYGIKAFGEVAAANFRKYFAAFLPAAVEDRGQGLVDEEAQHRVQEALEDGEGHIEGHQAVQKAVSGGPDGLIHGDDGVNGHELGVNGIGNEVVHGDGQQPHDHRAHSSAQHGAPAGLAVFIDEPGGQHEARAQKEVGKLPHPAGGGHHQALDDVLRQAHHDAGEGSHTERGQQGRQLRDIQLDELRHEGHAELQQHQHGGDGGQHGGDGDAPDLSGHGRGTGGNSVGFLHLGQPPMK